MVTVRWRCGHTTAIDPDKTPSPICACGERTVAGVVGSPTPRFTGVASGPHCDTRKLDAIAVSLAEKPLALRDRLKES